MRGRECEAGNPPPLVLCPTAQFGRDVKRERKRGKKMARLWTLIELLRQRRPLGPRHKDHALAGDWKGWRDCHIEPDWLLIYKQEGNELKLARTGTHADLFT